MQIQFLNSTPFFTINKERTRASEVEESARDLATAHEERVASLEARLADLSLTVASYDRTKQEDLLAIQKLKVRICMLWFVPILLMKDKFLYFIEPTNFRNPCLYIHKSISCTLKGTICQKIEIC